MKKTVLTIIFALLTVLAAIAAPPALDCEQYFSEKYRNRSNTKVVIVTSSDNYFRSIKVEGDPALVKAIHKSVEKDGDKASNRTETYSADKTSIILNFPGGINIGYTKYEPGECKLFVQGPLKAFK